MPKTQYFTADSMKFLADLRTHNDKEWFDKNRTRYEEGLKEPALQLISDLQPALRKISKHFVADARSTGGSLSRMNRDIRFSKDKSPYKTALFMHFRHARGTEEAAPSFYLHIEPGGATVGGGVWQPAPKQLSKLRDAIVSEPAAWARAISGGGAAGACLMKGEALKRVPPGYDAEHKYAEDLKRKDFGRHRMIADSELTGSRLAVEIADGFRDAAPLMRFVCAAVDLPF